MKKIFSLIFLLSSLIGFSQRRTVDTVIRGTGLGSGTGYNVRMTYDPNTPDSNQAIIFTVGLGQMNTNASGLTTWGPHAALLNGGWDGSVVLGNGVHYPVLITIQPPAAAFARPDYMKAKIDVIINLPYLKIKKNCVHLTGLSQGGWASALYVTYQPTTGDYTWMKQIASVANIQGVVPSDTYGATPPYANRFRYYALNGGFNSVKGGKYIAFEQSHDGRNLKKGVDTMNAVVANSAYFQITNYGAGGHTDFDKWYGGVNPPIDTFNIMGLHQSIYQWMLRQGDTISTFSGGGGANQAPFANAGSDKSVTLPTSSTTLDGGGSVDDVGITSYAWSFISGPATPTIVSSSSVSTSVTGLSVAGTYVFRLTVQDAEPLTSTDDVSVVVSSASNQSPVISSTTGNQTLTLPTNSLSIGVTANDPDGTIASYAWTKTSGPSTYTIVTPSTANTSITGLVEGVYTFQCTVTDNSGATATANIVVTVNPSGSTSSKFVKVNVYGGTNPYSNSQWNNWNTTGSLTLNDMNYSDGTTSTIDVILSGQQAVSDNGASYGGVIAPPEVLRYTSYRTTSRTLTISGLNNSKTYNIELFASRSTTGNATRFVLNGNTVDMTTDNNLTNSVTYSNISPSSGNIVITITVASGTYNYLNGLIITENGSGGSNTLPTVNAGTDITIDLPTNSVSLSATASDADGAIASYQWSKISGPSSFTITSPNSASTTITGLVQGSYTFAILVTDNQGGTATDQINVFVTNNPINQPPNVNAGIDKIVSLSNPSVALSGSASDDGSISSYQWSKTKVPSQTTMRVGIIGSSTAAGTGATTFDSSVIGRFKTLYQKTLHIVDSVYNFSVAGLYITEGLPSDTTGNPSYPSPAVGRNTNALITRSPKPKVALVMFPSNGYDNMTITEVMQYYRTIYWDLVSNGIETYITTSQPRPQFNETGQENLRIIRDSIMAEYGSHAIDFFSPISQQGTNDMLAEYSFGDGIHVNNAGHERLFQKIVAANIFQNQITSTAVINSPSNATTSISSLPSDTSIFQLSVVDNKGLSNTDFVTVIVQETVVNILPKVYMGEYQAYIRDEDKKLFGLSVSAFAVGGGTSTGSAVPPLLVAIPSNLTIEDAASGLHHSLAVDNNGEVWTWGWNDMGQAGNGIATGNSNIGQIFTPYKILTDSSGATFTNVVKVASGYSTDGTTTCSYNVALKADGTVWAWGNLKGGLRGNGTDGDTSKLPVQILIPTKTIIDIKAGQIIIALASDGTVWTWGGFNFRLHNLGRGTVTGIDWRTPGQVAGITDAVGIAGGNQHNYCWNSSGTLYGWGWMESYLSGKSWASNSPRHTAIDLTSTLNLPAPVSKVVTTTATTHAILTNGQLWGWGDNSMGGIGIGTELDFSIYTSDAPPYAGSVPAPYAHTLGVGQLMQTPVRVLSQFNDFVDIFGGNTYVYYNYAERANGQLYSWARNKTGVLGNGIVGPNSSIIAVYPNSWDVPTATPVDPLGLTSQTIVSSPYCFQNPSGSPCNTYALPNQPPIVSAGADKVILYPIISTSVTGTATDGDGTIASTLWTKISGPGSYTITAPTSLATSFSNLAIGEYTFRLTATDNLGSVATDDVKITVKQPQGLIKFILKFLKFKF